MLTNRYTALAVLHDVVASIIAWVLAYLLRFNFDLPPPFRQEVFNTLLWIVPLQSLVFWYFSLYRGIWRYASVADLRRILVAVITASALIPAVLTIFRLDFVVPRSVLVIDPLLLLVLMGGSRFVYRLWKENRLYGDFHLRGEPILVMGAGEAAVALSKDLHHSTKWHLVGFLDDDPRKHKRVLNGIKVLGGLAEISDFVERLGVKRVVIAMPSADHQERKRAIELANNAGAQVMTVPSYDDLLSGRIAISQFRAVELDDLLGRDPVQLDDAGLHSLLTGKKIIVTGAGGSIGSELCRQIARFQPAQLLLFEANEFALYNIEQELVMHYPTIDLVPLMGDVKDKDRLEQVFSVFSPSVVFHAAAYKHVPLMEHQNCWQAVKNNVYGTCCVAGIAQRFGAEKFVLISTDKAVNPTNVMGTTKRLAEMICQGLQKKAGTQFVIVRFGNVLGSNGSVIPKFREQISRGGPITVTHPEITRFFMSIPEAAQLVMQAGLMGRGGEIFVLDMGEPVKIVDLAKDLIRLSGLGLDEVKIEFTGLRPGEKLYEELLADSEHTLPTPHPKLRIAQARLVDGNWINELIAWVEAGTVLSDNEVKRRLMDWVPEYLPTEN